MTPDYVGRFAPTPSGYLHFGSLLAALASYLDARHAQGRWLVRMEDIDPPRELPGAQTTILHTLEAYGFEWDGPVTRQSQRYEVYAAIIDDWLHAGLAYACTCTRKQLRGHTLYPGFCREARKAASGAAIRIRVPNVEYAFNDRIQGRFGQQLARDVGDFIIRRRDGLYAYQLAVVIDDAWQGITDIVRGADLLDSTPRQLYLQDLIGSPSPRYLHVPLIVQPDGQKLGKSYRSPPLPEDRAGPLLIKALSALGQEPDRCLHGYAPAEILKWGIQHWRWDKIPRQLQLFEHRL